MKKSIMKKRVGVLMGGASSERDISIKSGKAVYSALEGVGVSVVPIELERRVSENDYAGFVKQKLNSSNIDVAFIALHGTFGEDGTIQEILEDIDIPYTGSKVLASQQGMDKISSKRIFKSHNIPIPRHITIHKTALDKRRSVQLYFKELGLPLVIKPSGEGSSIGLAIVDSEKDFYAALNCAFKYSDTVIIEEYVRGREITVGILDEEALPIVEVISKRRFFDYRAKYEKGLSEYKVPAKIGEKEYRTCQKIALEAHRALGASYFSRVDMILSCEGRGVVLELNTIPGLTETSLLPKAAMAAGIDFRQLILKILESAF